ncbi:DNA-binding protein [Actinoplanes sp. NPDC051851]|uniref:DNA-binding protein n=1 Tax=Actinoplanes sp. NPDC051851 TaxID=3154753 RepID=UPI0034389B6B
MGVLMGVQEIARRLAVTRQRVQQLTERADWPDPVDELAMGRVWLASDIEAWIAERDARHRRMFRKHRD